MALKKGFKQLVDEAEAEIETISAEDAKQLVDDENTVIVDLRDIRELWNSGTIPGSVHACGSYRWRFRRLDRSGRPRRSEGKEVKR